MLTGQLDYGHGTHEVADDAEDDDAGLSARVLAHFRSPAYRAPTLPRAALELHQLAQRADVDTASVVAVLEKDALLAGRVLARAGSAAFGGKGAASLRDAVMRLGMRELRDLVWEVAMGMRVFRAPRYMAQLESVQRHLVASAHVARIVAAQTPFPGEYAFLCGLLHDVGISASLVVVAELSAHPPEPTALRAALRATHAETSRLVAELWRLSDDVQCALATHHHLTLRKPVHPLAAIVAVAQELARRLGCGVDLGDGRAFDVTPEPELARALASLRISQAQLDGIAVDAQAKLATL